jgi:hypothetical protein
MRPPGAGISAILRRRRRSSRRPLKWLLVSVPGFVAAVSAATWGVVRERRARADAAVAAKKAKKKRKSK